MGCPRRLATVAGLGLVLVLACSRANVQPLSQKVDVTTGRSDDTLYDRALRKQARKPAPPRKLSARDHFHRGNEYERQKMDDQAITSYTQAVTMDSNMVGAWYRRAMIYLRRKLYAAAIMDFDQLLAVAPDFVHARYARAIASATVGQHDQAIRDLSVVIAKHAENPRAYYQRGRSYYAKKDFDGALQDFSKGLALQPQDSSGYFYRGLSHYGMGNYNSAVLDYTRALLYDPKSVATYVNRCWALALLGRAQKAREDCAKAVSLNPRIPHAYDALAFVFWQIGDKDEAFAALTRAKALDDAFMVPKERYQEFPVLLAQSLLKAIGYDPGTVDGEMGAATRGAIRKFQADRKLAVTGTLSQALLERLRKTPAARYLHEARVPNQ